MLQSEPRPLGSGPSNRDHHRPARPSCEAAAQGAQEGERPLRIATVRTRFPGTARTRILASTTRALPVIPLLLARSLAYSLVLLHQLVFAGAPGRDHFVQVLRGGTHGFEFGLPASLLCGDIVAERLSVPHDRQRSVRFQVARELRSE